MKASELITVMCVYVVATCLFLLERHSSTLSETNKSFLNLPPSAASALPGENGNAQLPDEQDTDWLEEYESNGPGSGHAVAMLGLSPEQFGLVIFACISTFGLAMFPTKKQPASSPWTNNE